MRIFKPYQMSDINHDPYNDQFEIIRNDPENPTPISFVIGALLGAFVGVHIYLHIYPHSSTAIFAGAVVCIVTTVILRFVGKYFWVLCLISYVIYVLSNL